MTPSRPARAAAQASRHFVAGTTTRRIVIPYTRRTVAGREDLYKKASRIVTAVFVYASSLLGAVLMSRLAQRTVLSTALLYLAAGFVVGDGMLSLVVLEPDDISCPA